IGPNALWRWRGNAVTFTIMTVLTIAMPLAMIVISLWTPILLPRTVLWLTVPATVAIALGTLGSTPTPLRRCVFAALVAVNLYGLWNYHAHFRKEDWRGVAALVAQQFRDGCAIVFCRCNLEIPFNYYFRETGLEPRTYRIDSAANDNEVARIVTSAVDSAPRVWLVYGQEGLGDPQGAVPEALARASHRLSRQTFYAVRVDLYDDR